MFKKIMEGQNFGAKETMDSNEQQQQPGELVENHDLNNINDINQDVLQQALQQSLLTEMEQEFQQDAFLANQYSDEINKNIFTLFETEPSSEDANVEISVEQAEALGFALDPITKEVISIGKSLELNNIQALEIQPINLETNNQFTLQEDIGNKSEMECLISNEPNSSFDISPFINGHLSIQQEVTPHILEEALNSVDLRNIPLTDLQNAHNSNLNNLECIKINTISTNLNNLLKEIKLNNITNVDSAQFCKQVKINNNVKTPKENLESKIIWAENEVNKKISNVVLNSSNFLNLLNMGKTSKTSVNSSSVEPEQNIIENLIESAEIQNLRNDENVNIPIQSSTLLENTSILSSHNTILEDAPNKNKQNNEIILNLNKSKLSVPHFNATKPLGSSENPIQLVQQGPTFHSMQLLNQEQLRQITTVLQNHTLDASQKGKNIFYDAQTNTRIIYRIVYPEELNLHDPNKDQQKKDNDQSIEDKPAKNRGRGRPPNTLKKQSLEITNQQESNKKDNEDIQKKKKKKIARTRSGRLSRPPRHMIKDYKRIHSVDLSKADLDDTEEYYSDYRNSEQDDNGENKELLTGLTIPTKKRQISSQYHCPTCSKIYLGYTRMANHFTAFPDHGNIDQLKTTLEKKEEKLKKILENSTRRGKKRGSWNSELRRIKIKELIQTSSKEELGELIGPTISNIFSLCELAVLRLDSLRNQNENLIKFILKEVSQLVTTLRKVASEILFPYSEESSLVETSFKLIDKDLCTILGLNEGNYKLDATKLQLNHLLTEEATLLFCKRMKKDNENTNEFFEESITMKELNTNCEKNLNNLNSIPFSENDKSLTSEINGKISPQNSNLIAHEELSTNEAQNELETVDDIVNERLDTLNCFSNSKVTNNANLHSNLNEFQREDNFEAELTLVNNSDTEQRMEDFSNLVQIQHDSLNNVSFSVDTVSNFDPDIALNEIVNDESSKHNLNENFLSNSISNSHNYDRVLGLETLESKQLNYSNSQTVVTSSFESDIEMIDSSNMNTNNVDSENSRRQFQIPALTALEGSELDFEAFTQFESNTSPR